MARTRASYNAYDPANSGQTLATSDRGVLKSEYDANAPWADLGADVGNLKTVAGMMKAAGLAWGVEKRPLFMEDGTKVPAFALCRDTDGQYFDTVGKDYIPVQNIDAFELFEEFLEAGGAKMEVAGSLRNGAYVWGLANLGTAFTLPGGDEVKGYILVACPHIQGKKLVAKFTSIRGACNNMLASAIRSIHKSKGGVMLPEFRFAHRQVFGKVQKEAAKVTLGIAREQLDHFGEQAAILQKKRMTRQEAIDVLQPIFAPKFEGEDGEAMTMETLTPRMKQLMDILEKAPGAQPDNAWGVLNAVTYYADHVASRTTDKRLTNAWFGKTGNQKLLALEALIAA